MVHSQSQHIIIQWDTSHGCPHQYGQCNKIPRSQLSTAISTKPPYKQPFNRRAQHAPSAITSPYATCRSDLATIAMLYGYYSGQQILSVHLFSAQVIVPLQNIEAILHSHQAVHHTMSHVVEQQHIAQMRFISERFKDNGIGLAKSRQHAIASESQPHPFSSIQLFFCQSIYYTAVNRHIRYSLSHRNSSLPLRHWADSPCGRQAHTLSRWR